MHKKILFISALILIFLTIFLTYFSIYGIKTNSLNSFINNKVNEYNSKLTIQVELKLSDNFIDTSLNSISLEHDTNKISK